MQARSRRIEGLLASRGLTMVRDASAEKVEWRDTNGLVQWADNVGVSKPRLVA